MSDNVLIAVIAACGVVISALCVLAGAVFAFAASNKRLDKIEATLGTIQLDMREFFRMHSRLEAKVDAKQSGD